MISILDSIDAQDDNPEDVSEIIESFRQKAVNLLELLDLSIPTIAKLRVHIKIVTINNIYVGLGEGYYLSFYVDIVPYGG